jgi:hypothetical protein
MLVANPNLVDIKIRFEDRDTADWTPVLLQLEASNMSPALLHMHLHGLAVQVTPQTEAILQTFLYRCHKLQSLHLQLCTLQGPFLDTFLDTLALQQPLDDGLQGLVQLALPGKAMLSALSFLASAPPRLLHVRILDSDLKQEQLAKIVAQLAHQSGMQHLALSIGPDPLFPSRMTPLASSSPHLRSLHIESRRVRGNNDVDTSMLVRPGVDER